MINPMKIIGKLWNLLVVLNGCKVICFTVGFKRNKGEAIKDYERIVAANPKNAIAYNNLGVAYLKEEFDRAMVNFRKAIGLEQDYADAHNNLGNVYYKTGQRKEAYDSIM